MHRRPATNRRIGVHSAVRRPESASWKRRGLATLETVLSFPILIALAAMIMAVGSASVRKSVTAVEARHASWQKRTELPGAAFPLEQLSRGLREASATSQMQLPTTLWSSGGGQTISAESSNSLIIGRWDDPHAGLEREVPWYRPHRVPFEIMTARTDVSGLESLTELGDTTGWMSSLYQGSDKSLGISLGNVSFDSSALSGLAMSLLGEIGGIGSLENSGLESMIDGLMPVCELAGDVLGGIDSLFGPADKALGQINKYAKGLADYISAQNKDSGGSGFPGVGAVVDLATKIGKSIQELGKQIGGDFGEGIAKLGGGIEEAAEAPGKIFDFIDTINGILKSGRGSFANLADAVNGGPADAPTAMAQIQQMANNSEELKKMFDEIRELLTKFGF